MQRDKNVELFMRYWDRFVFIPIRDIPEESELVGMGIGLVWKVDKYKKPRVHVGAMDITYIHWEAVTDSLEFPPMKNKNAYAGYLKDMFALIDTTWTKHGKRSLLACNLCRMRSPLVAFLYVLYKTGPALYRDMAQIFISTPFNFDKTVLLERYHATLKVLIEAFVRKYFTDPIDSSLKLSIPIKFQIRDAKTGKSRILVLSYRVQ